MQLIVMKYDVKLVCYTEGFNCKESVLSDS